MTSPLRPKALEDGLPEELSPDPMSTGLRDGPPPRVPSTQQPIAGTSAQY